MSTRLKRPPFWRHVALAVALIGFQGYLGYSAMNGQFGVESRDDILSDIAVLDARSASLQAEIDSFRHRASLFNARKLDPDILDERARALLNMAHATDVIVMIDQATGQPISGSSNELAADELTSIIDEQAIL